LALSSRNNYLSPTDRAEAVHLSKTLQAMAQALHAGASDLAALEQQAMAEMSSRGWLPDYLSVRQRSNLQAPAAEQVSALAQAQGLVILGAARIGKTRLIDNLEV
jgi:pantoate--beta-alanine ligase